MKFRVEVNSLAKERVSGVGYFAKRLTEAIANHQDTEVRAFFFSFLNRQPMPKFAKNSRITLEKNSLFPQRVYAKLYSFGIELPFDLFLKPVDVTILPNFATWPTVKTKIRGTIIHDLTYLHFPEFMEEKNLKHLHRIIERSIRQADFIMTPSEAVRSELIERFDVGPENCLALSVPPAEEYYKFKEMDVQEKYKIPTKKYIYFLSTLEPRKNIPTLVKAYQMLPQAIKDEYSLVISGGIDWKAESTLAAIKSAQDAGEKVMHTGYVAQEDLPTVYHSASAFVMPSTYEGFGMPLLEAMAAEVPTIASDIPVFREAAGEASLYARPSKPEEFAAQLEKILTSPKLQEELVRKGKKQLKQFSWEKNAEKLIHYCQERLR